MKITIKERNANALVTVLAVLFVVSVMAVSFTKLATGEMSAAKNYINFTDAKILSETGTQEAIARLQDNYRKDLFCMLKAGFSTGTPAQQKVSDKNWCYTAPKHTGTTAAEDDEIAAGVPVEDMAGVPAADAKHPSYYTTPINGLKYSGSVTNSKVYTLKIFDTSSQLDLNSQLVPLDASSPPVPESVDHIPMVANKPFGSPTNGSEEEGMLSHLSRAIALTGHYKAEFSDTKGPLYHHPTTGSPEPFAFEIIEKREELGGFSSKYDLLQVAKEDPPGSGTFKKLDPKRLKHLWDYVTVHTPARSVLARSAKLAANNQVEPYRPDKRSPININTASWPVLVTLFWGITDVNGTTITEDEAKALADHICKERRDNNINRHFVTWEQLIELNKAPDDPTKLNPNPSLMPLKYYFKVTLMNDATALTNIFGAIAASEIEKKMDILLANLDPNVALRRTNPDVTSFQKINKTDLSYYTTEVCFYSQGVFDITSLGQVIDVTGGVAAQAKTQTVAKVFSLLHKTTQKDFQSSQRIAEGTDPYVNKMDLNAFSYGNNLQTTAQSESTYFGFIQPMPFETQYDTYTFDASDDNPTLAKLDKSVTDGGEILFRCSFNRGLNDKGASPSTITTAKALDADISNGDDASGGSYIGEQIGDTTPTLPAHYGTASVTYKDGSKPALPNVTEINATIDHGDLMTDGVVFREAGVAINPEDRTLCYKTVTNMPDGTIAQPNGTFLLWFKLDENSQNTYGTGGNQSARDADDSSVQTIFFAHAPNENKGAGNEAGIQMKVQMGFKQTTGELKIIAHRKFYQKGAIADPATTSCPFYLETKIKKVFKDDNNRLVKPHMWYHLTIRWEDGTNMIENAVSIGEHYMKLHGNFYDTITSDSAIKGFDGTTAIHMTANETLKSAAVAADFAANLLGGTTDALETDHMYLGSVLTDSGLESIAMTVDNFALAKDKASANDGAFNPTRFPPYEESLVTTGNYFLGKFNGSFDVTSQENLILSVLDWTKRLPINFTTQLANTLTTANPDDPDFSGGSPLSDTSETTNEPITEGVPGIEKRKPILIDDSPLGLDLEVWEVLYTAANPTDTTVTPTEINTFIATFGNAIIEYLQNNAIATTASARASRTIEQGASLITQTQSLGSQRKINISANAASRIAENPSRASRISKRASKAISKVTKRVSKRTSKIAKSASKRASKIIERGDSFSLSDISDIDDFRNFLAGLDDADAFLKGVGDEVQDIINNGGGSGGGAPLGDDDPSNVDDTNFKPIVSPLQAIQGSGGPGSIAILPPAADFNYQLRFEQAQVSSVLAPQYASIAVDDVTLAYQGTVIYLEVAVVGSQQ